MDVTDHQHGQESHNTNAIELYVSILDLKINSNSRSSGWKWNFNLLSK